MVGSDSLAGSASCTLCAKGWYAYRPDDVCRSGMPARCHLPCDASYKSTMVAHAFPHVMMLLGMAGCRRCRDIIVNPNSHHVTVSALPKVNDVLHCQGGTRGYGRHLNGTGTNASRRLLYEHVVVPPAMIQPFNGFWTQVNEDGTAVLLPCESRHTCVSCQANCPELDQPRVMLPSPTPSSASGPSSWSEWDGEATDTVERAVAIVSQAVPPPHAYCGPHLTGFMCSKCADGFVKIRGQCTPCPAVNPRVVTFQVIGLLALAFVLLHISTKPSFTDDEISDV